MAALPLIDVLAEVPDPRSLRGRRHPFTAVLTLVVLAMLRGAKGPVAISQFGRDHGTPLAHALGFTRGKTPAASQLSRLLRRIDADAFEAALSRWVASRLPAGDELIISIDGKTLRGSKDGATPGQHLVAAYAPRVEAVLAQVRVDAKTNEHKAALELLGILPVRGRVVVGDAMFCQRDVCEKVIDEGGDYVLFAKENQPGLVADVAAGFGFEAGAKSIAAAFSPRRATAGAAPSSGRAVGGQGARAAGEADAADDIDPDEGPGLEGAQAGFRADAGADGEGGDDGGSGVRDHEFGGTRGGRGAVAGVDTRSLGDRERVALRAGRDAG